MNRPRTSTDPKPFSCLNVLLPVLVILILSVVFYPGGPPRRASKKTECLSNLKQIGLAIHMYMADNDNKFPPISGFGPELDKHKVLWGAEGTLFNRQESSLKYMPELLGPYVKNDKMFTCPVMKKYHNWKVPDGEVDFKKNGTSYIFNAWCVRDMSKTPPAGCIVIAGKKAEDCPDPASAPIAWDGMSGYGQMAHDDAVNVLYLDWHVKSDSSFAGTTNDRSGSYWGVYGAKGWFDPSVNTK